MKKARQELETRISDFKWEASLERLESLEKQVEQLERENRELRLRNSELNELKNENRTLSERLRNVFSWLPPDVANQLRNMLGELDRKKSDQKKQRSNEER